MRRHTPLRGSVETHREWQRRSMRAAIERRSTVLQRAPQTHTRPPVHTPAKVRDLVVARSIHAFGADPDDYPRGLCELCARPATNTHTRRPDGMGGTKRPETYRVSNKIRVCGQGNITRCHGHLECNRTWALERGLLVPQNHNPAEKSARLGYGLVLLDDLGGFELLDDNHNPEGAAA